MKFIEATLILPMTILIVIFSITLMMNMYNDLVIKENDNKEKIKIVYDKSAETELRRYGILSTVAEK